MRALPRRPIRCALAFAAATVLWSGTAAQAEDTLRIPVLVPITGFLSLEGTSQRNGAELALTGSKVAFSVEDTATSPEVAVNAFERTAGTDGVVAIVAPMLGTQMLALVPLADEFAIPWLRSPARRRSPSWAAQTSSASFRAMWW